METNAYQTLRILRDERRPKVVAEPTFTQGVLWPSISLDKPIDQVLHMGIKTWTRIAMATVITVGNTLGWREFLNMLDKRQRPGNAKRAAKLVKEFNIEGTSAASCVNLMVAWAKGCQFNWHTHPYVSEHELKGFGTYCPQVQAVKEMGLGEQSENMRLWCDAYDGLISQSLNPECRMVHAHCPCSGERYCMFYIFEAPDPKKKDFFDQLTHFNEEKRKLLEKNPEPDYMEGVAAPRFIEHLSHTDMLKDGVYTKGFIAIENMLLAASTMGWERFINLVAKEHEFGYGQEALELRRDFDVKGSSLRDAANLLAIGYGMLGFSHCLNEYTPTKIEGVAKSCPIIEAAKNLSMSADELKDVSLWCDFYHNHKIHTVNREAQLTHTHCLGCGDKCCRFVLKEN